jgi:hypothetical protein
MAKMDDKENFQLSGTTVFRRREPTNPKTAKHQAQMVFDVSKNMPVIPAAAGGNAARSTRTEHGVRTMNRDGKSAHTLPVMVGGAPDYSGAVFYPGKSDTTPAPDRGRQGGSTTVFGTMKRRT